MSIGNMPDVSIEVWYLVPSADSDIQGQTLLIGFKIKTPGHCVLLTAILPTLSHPRIVAWHVLYTPLSNCNLWHKYQSGFAIVDLKPAGPLAGMLQNSYSKCLAYNPRHPSTSTAKLFLLAGVISDWRWKCFLHLIRMPNQSEL